MNVNALENNPDWKWYLLFTSALLGVTILVWLLFKIFEVSLSICYYLELAN